VAPGTPSAWATPPAAPARRRLTITGGFCVDGGQHHQLDQQARRLGFADLRGCLQALLDEGWSIPQLAAHLATTQAAIRRAITDHHLRQPPCRARLARQRQRNAQQHAATRVAELGFQSVRAYLVDRLAERAWTLARVVDDLGAAPTTVRRLLDQHQVRRVGPTRRQRAVPGRGLGPRAPAHLAQQRRQARVTELGFAGIEGYLRDRYVGRGWSVRRLGAELGVSHGWLDRQLRRLGRRT
jgi:AraC-like DNA-binding protein